MLVGDYLPLDTQLSLLVRHIFHAHTETSGIVSNAHNDVRVRGGERSGGEQDEGPIAILYTTFFRLPFFLAFASSEIAFAAEKQTAGEKEAPCDMQHPVTNRLVIDGVCDSTSSYTHTHTQTHTVIHVSLLPFERTSSKSI